MNDIRITETGNEKKKRIAVLFGGCSTEYEVSLQSAHAVIENMDTDRYEQILIGISRQSGQWHLLSGTGRNPCYITGCGISDSAREKRRRRHCTGRAGACRHLGHRMRNAEFCCRHGQGTLASYRGSSRGTGGRDSDCNETV